MKKKNNIYILILIVTTLVGLWAIPTLVRKMTYTPEKYPFVYYSSGLKDLGIIDYKSKTATLRDTKGNVYDKAQIDSLIPLLNYRQLMSEGKMPDSIEGHHVDMKEIKMRSVNYRFSPKDVQTPDVGLYIMYESLPKRVGIKSPGDAFRLNDKIEFVDIESNSIDSKKSDLFQKALDKAGYAFPAQWTSGNMNPRKPYDEGYFSLDAKGQLYHIKMVNERPFVKNTQLGKTIDIKHFSMLEVSDKRFYGFLYDKQGSVYIIEDGGSVYRPVKLDIAPFDIETNNMVVMGDVLYWTVTVTTPEGQNYFGLDKETLKCLSQYHIDRQPGTWDKVSEWLFPAYLTFESKNSDYIQPCLHFTGIAALLSNLVLAVIAGACFKNRAAKRAFNFVFVLITGLVGILAILILPDFSKKQQ